jgi:hypothetical protein
MKIKKGEKCFKPSTVKQMDWGEVEILVNVTIPEESGWESVNTIGDHIDHIFAIDIRLNDLPCINPWF